MTDIPGDLAGLRHYIKRMVRCAKEGKPLSPAEQPAMPMDSDSVATFIASICLTAGLKTRFKIVAQKPEQEFHHVYVEVWYEPAQLWLPLDPHQAREKFGKEGIVEIE
jgi:hypothetical protein